ncbi:hypothetical protein GF340_00400 [Candidatus Peregrinibacteria bacterium]|nr:hypothetical protein [Candidatus Peregrinibacteria bacterium]
MNKKYIVATVGTLALAANIILPGLAFGQNSQTGTQELTCGAFGITSATSDFAFDALSVAPIDQPSFGAFIDPAGSNITYQDGTNDVPAEAVIEFFDYRVPGCDGGGLDGFNVQVSALTDFTSGSDTIPVSGNLFVATTPQATNPDNARYTLTGTAPNEMYYDADDYVALPSPTYDVTLPYNVGTSTTPVDLEAAGTFDSALNIPVSPSVGTIAVKPSTGSAFGEMAVGVAYNLNVPASTPSGTYSTTIEYTLIAA